jgi:hypothetical protein
MIRAHRRSFGEVRTWAAAILFCRTTKTRQNFAPGSYSIGGFPRIYKLEASGAERAPECRQAELHEAEEPASGID